MSAYGIYIIGPTASGKTELALEAAEAINAEGSKRAAIINADSIQFYRELIIGSARPSAEEMARVPHYLVGHCESGVAYNAGDFRRDVEDIVKNHTVDIYFIVGGSGFYIQALERGMYEVSSSDPEVRAGLEQKTTDELYSQMISLDPDLKISRNDRYRVVRALEIMLQDPLRRKLSEIRKGFESEADKNVFSRALKIGLEWPKPQLEARIRARTKKMLEQGLVLEVKALLEKGFQDWRALQSVGYLEVTQYLRGELAEADLEEKINERTLQLVKKQKTWFQRDKQISWYKSVQEAKAPIVEWVLAQ